MNGREKQAFTLGQPPTSYVVTCQVCGKPYKNKESVRAHKRRFHKIEKPKAADKTQSE